MGLQAAACTVDITPKNTPTTKPRLYGWGEHYADNVDDNIFANALLLAHGGVRTLVVSLDIAWASETETQTPSGPPPDSDGKCRVSSATLPAGTRKKWAAAAGIADAEGVAKENRITVHASHTHTAPGLIRDDNPAQTIENAIKELPGALKDVVVRAGTRECPLAVYRSVKKTTRAKHYPVDRTLTAMELLSEGRPVARLVNFGVHPILSRRLTMISPDFVGVAMRTLDSRRGGASLYLQGFSGELGPSLNGYYAGQALDPPGVRGMGVALADEVEAALEDAQTVDVESLGVTYQEMTNRPNEPPKLPLRKRSCIRGVDPVRLHGIRFGKSAVLVSVSAEVFSDYGPILKKYLFSSYRYVLTSGVANGYCGYLPSAAAFGRRSEIDEFEVDVSPFPPEMERMFLDSLRTLFG